MRLSEEYEVKDRSFKGAHGVANDFSETLVIHRLALDLRYGLTDDWTAELTPTYPDFKYRLKPPGGSIPPPTVHADGRAPRSNGTCGLRAESGGPKAHGRD